MGGFTRRTDIVILAYLVMVGALIVVFRESLPSCPNWKSLALVHLAAAGAVYALAFLPATLPSIARFFRDWYPAMAFPIFYKEVELLANAFGNWGLTTSLQRLEVGLFQGHPSHYLSEHLDSVVFSEYLHFCYFSYLCLFPVVGGIWYFTGKRRAFQELLFLVSVTFATSYVFYILFPVDSPFYLSESLPEPLSGNFFYELVHFLAARGGARGGAFPSSHVSVSTVIVLVTMKYQPRWLYWLLPIYTGLFFAAVYGRFHYALDVFAGWALAFAVGRYVPYGILHHGATEGDAEPSLTPRNRKTTMCRNIKTLFNFEPPATEEEIRAASAQFVRKLSGFNKPSQVNQEAFERAVEDVARVATSLIDSLVTNAPARDREIEAARARARAAKRFG